MSEPKIETPEYDEEERTSHPLERLIWDVIEKYEDEHPDVRVSVGDTYRFIDGDESKGRKGVVLTIAIGDVADMVDDAGVHARTVVEMHDAKTKRKA